MTQQAYGVFDNIESAERALSALKDHGADGNEVSVVRRSDGAGVPIVEQEASTGVTATTPADVVAGAAKGGAAGIALGILGGALALTIPGIGPILAAGPIATAVAAALATGAAGAVSGGVVGYFVDQGVSDDTAQRYGDALTRGNILVAVRAAGITTADALMIMEKYGATETSVHSIGAPMDGASEPPIIDRETDLVDAVPATRADMEIPRVAAG